MCSENGGFSMADFMHGEAINQPQLLGYYPLVMTNSLPWDRWPIEIDGLPINSMVDLSMANC